ncbi:MAG TPA: anthranilate phosphoribosyltransferase [Dehalococcoidia bacterium]|jgi:anthranilate phosphoribosyltransferase|nr:anthranilate phosphoribosyltransferase [Dehalococcoidia bacterium]MEE3006073.1 anthranilate phosphoribosyltransferase [Chloroflexota bacterium]HAI99693.1 anthranilate phosphoribosyltransferase [Dehalococcoidia bacterium]|tara:strand:+ start:312 stop:1337 length:1026 start_codon:yes stop_codon:yes gene_type:complete
MIRESIDTVVSGQSLSMEDASLVMREIMEGEATPAQLGAFLTALALKGETTQEIAGMAKVMREMALQVKVDGELIDTVGTGGDGKNTFNISTATAFVAAGAGLKVAKHGNRAASGSCGSADVLEALGVQIELSPEAVAQCVNEVGVGFMFAPAFHPAMRYAGPVRREIGIRTVFNILGPLTNPAGAQTQLLGVAFPELGGIMAEVLGFLGSHHAMIVHGHGGLDEISLSGDTSVWEVRGGEVEEWTLHVEDTGLPETPIEAIRGGTKEENAATMRRVFQGEQGPVRDMVLLNSAGVLMVGDKAESIRKGVEMSAGIIDSGAALAKLDQMIEVTQRLGQPDA